MLGVPDPHPRAVEGLVEGVVVLHARDSPPPRHQVHPEHVPLHLHKAVHVGDYYVRSYPGEYGGRHVGIVFCIQEPSAVSAIQYKAFLCSAPPFIANKINKEV